MNKGLFTLLGFLLFILGFLSLVLSMIGIQLAFLLWIDLPGPLFGFLIRLGMIIGGVIIVAVAQTDWKRERSESL
ncbi:MAG: hypothetical protein IPH04_17745 [Saprospirales bacterium]|jgi:hypothetical protein|nr:hypothetical protein [Saprospirales bacterium]MBK6904587.1 hypothetical protein [Saprospirales bacterium]MBK7336220.1 hypothetical protein [Saprospirales bacterium]